MTDPSAPREQRPVGGRIWTPTFVALFVVFLVGFALIVWRFAVGLGPSTALSDGYPWGLWIAFDVVIGTALASGGFAVALLVFLLNRWRYHPLVRPALLVSALGYSIALLSLIVDVGRPWNFWKVPVFWGDWNLNAALLEVALCMSAYTAIVWIELSPTFLERWARVSGPRMRRLAAAASRAMRLALPWLLAVGVILPLMHQSSLGTLMVLTGHKLHPLWQTPLLPLLFVLSSFMVGLGAVTMESAGASLSFGRPIETSILAPLMRVAALSLLVWVVIRFVDLALRGVLGLAFAFDTASVLFLLETALFLVPAAMLWRRRVTAEPGHLFRVAMVMLVAGGLYRLNAFLIAFNPGAGWAYFPNVVELLITLGLIALEIMLYLVVVRRFPVLSSAPTSAPRARRSA